MTDTTPTRRIVPAHIPDPMFEAGEASISESFAMKYGNGMAARRVYTAMLAASPASGKVSEVEKAAEALYRCDQDGLRKAAYIGMKLVSGAITPWQNLHPENRDGYLIRARASLASLGLEVE